MPHRGASIRYATQAVPNPRRLLYPGEVPLPFPVRLPAKAIRCGFLESEETVAELEGY